MVCPNCKHVYPISNGIPNMVRARISISPYSLHLSSPLCKPYSRRLHSLSYSVSTRSAEMGNKMRPIGRETKIRRSDVPGQTTSLRRVDR